MVPRSLVCASFRLEPLGPEHNEGDYRAWTSSIRYSGHPGFEGRPWPQSDMTLAENLGDLQRHASDFAARSGFQRTRCGLWAATRLSAAFTFTRPLTVRAGFRGSGAAVRSWVSADRASLDVVLYDAVSRWLRSAWPFTEVRYAPR